MLLVWTAAPLAARAGARPDFSDEDRRRLEAGEVIVDARTLDGEDHVVVARAVALVDQPPARVWPHIDQCARYQEYMPRVVESRELRRECDEGSEGACRVDCFVKLDMPFPLSDLWSKTEARHDRVDGQGYRRRWRLVEGSYRVNQGSWVLLPWTPEGGSTLVIYQIKVAPRASLPPAFLRQAQRRSLPGLMEAIRKRSKL